MTNLHSTGSGKKKGTRNTFHNTTNAPPLLSPNQTFPGTPLRDRLLHDR